MKNIWSVVYEKLSKVAKIQKTNFNLEKENVVLHGEQIKVYESQGYFPCDFETIDQAGSSEIFKDFPLK